MAYFTTPCYSKWVRFHFPPMSNSTFYLYQSCPPHKYLFRKANDIGYWPKRASWFHLIAEWFWVLHALLVILASACGRGCLMLDIIICHLNGPDVVSLLRAEPEPKSTILPFTTTKIKMLSFRTRADWPGFWPKHNRTQFFSTPAHLSCSID